MQRLTGLDAAFLSLETPSAHMQVMGDRGRRPDHVDAGVLVRARARAVGISPASDPAVPAPHRRSSARPARADLDRGPAFDLDYHLRRAALPAPGGEHELSAFVADVAGRPLDRTRPLWEAWVVEGLDHGYYAFIAKIHHSLIDGASGVEILASLFDLEPDPEPKVTDIAPEWEPEHVPSDAELLSYAALSFARAAGAIREGGEQPREERRPRGPTGA